MPLFLNDTVDRRPTDEELDQLKQLGWALDPEDPENSAVAIFLLAATKNDVRKVNEGLAHNLPLEIFDETTGFSYLTAAARYGALDVVRVLIQFGFDPANAHSNTSEDPNVPSPSVKMAYNTLHAACAGGHFAIAHELLTQFPALLNSTEPFYQQSGLQLALLYGQVEFANRFIGTHKPNLNHIDSKGRSTLAFALGNYIHNGYENIKREDTYADLSSLCLRLLKEEDAFNPGNSVVKPAISLIFTNEFSLNLPTKFKFTERPSTEKIIKRVLKNCPEVAATLKLQAQAHIDRNDLTDPRQIQWTKDYLFHHAKAVTELAMKEKSIPDSNMGAGNS